MDGGAGVAGGECDAGVRGRVGGVLEGTAVTDAQEDRGRGLDADSWNGDQDLGKREVIDQLLDFGGQDSALVPEFLDLGGDARDDHLHRRGANYGHGLLV